MLPDARDMTKNQDAPPISKSTVLSLHPCLAHSALDAIRELRTPNTVSVALHPIKTFASAKRRVKVAGSGSGEQYDRMSEH